MNHEQDLTTLRAQLTTALAEKAELEALVTDHKASLKTERLNVGEACNDIASLTMQLTALRSDLAQAVAAREKAERELDEFTADEITLREEGVAPDKWMRVGPAWCRYQIERVAALEAQLAADREAILRVLRRVQAATINRNETKEAWLSAQEDYRPGTPRYETAKNNNDQAFTEYCRAWNEAVRLMEDAKESAAPSGGTGK